MRDNISDENKRDENKRDEEKIEKNSQNGFVITGTRLRFITYTAMMLALTIVVQNLRLLIGSNWYSTVIIGTLINFILLFSSEKVGVWGSVIIAVIAPIIATFQGHISPIHLAPVVVIGNLIFPLVYWYLKKINSWLAVGIGAIAKSAFLFFAVKMVIDTLIIPNANNANVMSLATSAQYTWPQLLTACLGGVIFLMFRDALLSHNS